MKVAKGITTDTFSATASNRGWNNQCTEEIIATTDTMDNPTRRKISLNREVTPIYNQVLRRK